MSAKSLLFSGDLPFSESADCKPGRVQQAFTMRKDGRLYRFIVRDKICIEDPYLMLVKAAAFAIRTGEAYGAQVPQRPIRDFLIKQNITI